MFAALVSGGAVLWLSDKGHINLGYWLGVCGFKQRFGLPCPGCGWTHAAQLFVCGHPIQAFTRQPAAAIFCLAATLSAIYALLIALFGIDFSLLRRWIDAVGVKTLVVGAAVIIVIGWVVTLWREIHAG